MLLSVRNLSVRIRNLGGDFHPVKNISFDVNSGETLAIIGETGSGKTMVGLSLIGLLPDGAEVVSGEVRFCGEAISPGSPKGLKHLGGRHIAMVFQNPGAALNPVFRVGSQITEVIRTHLPLSKTDARTRTIELLAQSGLAEPGVVYRSYPHQLSGGMAQRVMIAMALSCRPKLIIADEPTTALDITTQIQIIQLLRNLQIEHRFALLLISHDLSIVGRLADSVLVMHAGKPVEQGPAGDILRSPRNSYTQELIGSILECPGSQPRDSEHV